MLASVRFAFLLCLLFAIALAVSLPVQAQTAGVPASVTSMGFGGRPVNGISPSVTSLSSNGYGNNWSVFGNCCANFFLPANLNTEHRHHHRKKDGAELVGVIEPVYIPYAPADASEEDENEDVVDQDSNVASGPRNPDLPITRAPHQDAADQSLAAARPHPGESWNPVPAQVSTMLVFKDGHRSEVFNYAIAGDTLFDFDPGRTRKIPLADLDLPATRRANDDRGVDFEIPAGTGQ